MPQAYDEIELTTRKVEHGGMEVMLDTEKYPVEIRYTLDGKIPGATSLRYDKPFFINDSVVVKAAIFREGKILGPILERNVGTEKEIRNYFEYVEPEHWKNVKQ